jgi:hypothetical protein
MYGRCAGDAMSAAAHGLFAANPEGERLGYYKAAMRPLLSTNERGAKLMVAAPDHLASLDDAVGKNQVEFARHFGPEDDIKPYAGVGNVENPARARLTAGPALHLGDMVEVTAQRSAPLFIGFQRLHDAPLLSAAAP